MFATDLLDAYRRYAERLGLKTEQVDDLAVIVSGAHCYKPFRNESGTHCVQRVPPTERSGRRQTSFISVAVLPVLTQQKFQINLDEIEITTQCGHGKGGQNQNKVASAVRVVHRPTGTTVFINGRDQHQNRRTALQVLSARLEYQKITEDQQAMADLKSSQFGSSGRGGSKIRTYNFIDSRVTDHRSGAKTTRIDEVMKGKFELVTSSTGL